MWRAGRYSAMHRKAKHPASAGAHGHLRSDDGHGRSSHGACGLQFGETCLRVGAGNATMVIDETADIVEAAQNTRISKTNDYGSGCSADGNLIIEASIYDAFLAQLQKEGGHLVSDAEKKLLQAAYWDAEGHRTADTIARAA